jgi:hypothetical protein
MSQAGAKRSEPLATSALPGWLWASLVTARQLAGSCAHFQRKVGSTRRGPSRPISCPRPCRVPAGAFLVSWVVTFLGGLSLE